MKKQQALIVLEEKQADGEYGQASVTHATLLSAGFDLMASESAVIEPGAWQAVDTGLRIKAAAPGTIRYGDALVDVVPELQIRPRSGLAFKNGVTVLNSPGTIDADYRGPIKVILINHGKSSFEIKPGDRIAQGVVAIAVKGSAKTLGDVRGEGGFGSTGK